MPSAGSEHTPLGTGSSIGELVFANVGGKSLDLKQTPFTTKPACHVVLGGFGRQLTDAAIESRLGLGPHTKAV